MECLLFNAFSSIVVQFWLMFVLLQFYFGYKENYSLLSNVISNHFIISLLV